MIKNNRVFDGIYTISIIGTVGQTVNVSTPQYFQSANYLANKTVKAISVTENAFSARFLITLVDTSGTQLLFNTPFRDLLQTINGNPNEKLRLFRLKNIDLQRSYYTSVIPFGYATTSNIFNINFYI